MTGPAGPKLPWMVSGKVDPEWMGRGGWLSQAAEAFAEDHELAQYRHHVEQFAALREGETPETFEMSSRLSGAAKDKELISRLIHDEERRAFGLYKGFMVILQITLKHKLNSGHLIAFGRRGAPDADFCWIPPEAWFYLTLHLDEGNVVRGANTAYWHVRVVNPSEFSPPTEVQSAVVQKPDVKTILQADLKRDFDA